MKLKRPIRFYRSLGFWLSLAFLWVAYFGFPRTMAVAGDYLIYPIIVLISLVTLLTSIFSFKKLWLAIKRVL